jgi:ABC-type multidrug transport system ATPase subunit
MDDVDALSDRIAIINNGEVKCFGSPEFLRKSLHFNYTLRMSIDQPVDFNRTQLNSFLLKNTKNYEIQYETTNEVLVRFHIDHETNLPGFLEDLNDQIRSCDITNYTLNSTKIEDVFLRSPLIMDSFSFIRTKSV